MPQSEREIDPRIFNHNQGLFLVMPPGLDQAETGIYAAIVGQQTKLLTHWLNSAIRYSSDKKFKNLNPADLLALNLYAHLTDGRDPGKVDTFIEGLAQLADNSKSEDLTTTVLAFCQEQKNHPNPEMKVIYIEIERLLATEPIDVL